MPATLPYLSRRVRELRKSRQMNYRELATASGVHWTNIWKIENGKIAKTSIGTVQRLCWALGVSLAVFDEPRPAA